MRILAVALVILTAGRLAAQLPAADRPQQTTIVGLVTDSTSRPLAGAEIRLIDDDTEIGSTRSDEEGRFVATGNIRGRSRLHVQHLGFRARTVELFFPRDSTRPLLIQLESAAPPDSMAGRDSPETDGLLREFYQRRRSNSLGHYFTRDDLVRRQPQFLSEVLRSVPGITISQSRTGGFVLRMRGCRYAPVVWLDGTRLPGLELDEVARTDDVSGLEVYPTPAGVPAQYLDRSNVGCGTILVWTRLQ